MRPGTLVRALIIFIAMCLLLVAYYWVHRPFGVSPDNPRPDAILRVGGALLDLLTTGVIFAAAGGLGRALLSRLDVPSRAERFALEGGIGLGVLALTVLALGLIGVLNGILFAAGLIAALMLLRRAVIDWLRTGFDLVRGIRLENTATTLIVVFVGVLLIAALIMALAPPFHWDGMTYHLIAPTRYLHDGRILMHADNFYLGLSQNVEMLYTLGIGLFGRDTAAAPIHWGIGLLGLIGVAGLVRRFAGTASAWLALLLLLSAYNLWALFGWSYVDLGAFLYGSLALIAAVRWRETRGRGWLILMGVIVGLAVGVKYTAGSIAVALIVFLLIREPRRFIQNAAIFGAAAALVFGLWAVKGITLYGNPIYPFVFNGVNWDAGRSASFSYTDRGFLATGDAWQIPILPVSATVLGQDNVDTYGFTAGAWLLTSFLLLPLVWRDLDPRARGLAKDALTILLPLIAVWMVLAAWSITGTQTRLMLGALPAFAVTGALGFAGLANFPKKPLDVNWMVRAALTITVALGLFDVVNTFVKDKPAPYLLGQMTLDDYMYTNTGAYYGALQNLATLPEGSQVRLMWEPRSYYCPPTITCSGDVLFDHWSMPLRNGATVEEVFAGYRAAGDDYLLLFMTGYETYLSVTQHDEYDQQFAAAIEQSMTPVWTDGLRYTLYGWKADG